MMNSGKIEFIYRWLSKKVYPPLAAPEATRVHIQGVVFFEAPCSKLQESFDCKEFCLFFDSLANPAASCGECARCAVQERGHTCSMPGV